MEIKLSWDSGQMGPARRPLPVLFIKKIIIICLLPAALREVGGTGGGGAQDHGAQMSPKPQDLSRPLVTSPCRLIVVGLPGTSAFVYQAFSKGGSPVPKGRGAGWGGANLWPQALVWAEVPCRCTCGSLPGKRRFRPGPLFIATTDVTCRGLGWQSQLKDEERSANAVIWRQTPRHALCSTCAHVCIVHVKTGADVRLLMPRHTPSRHAAT